MTTFDVSVLNTILLSAITLGVSLGIKMLSNLSRTTDLLARQLAAVIQKIGGIEHV